MSRKRAASKRGKDNSGEATRRAASSNPESRDVTTPRPVDGSVIEWQHRVDAAKRRVERYRRCGRDAKEAELALKNAEEALAVLAAFFESQSAQQRPRARRSAATVSKHVKAVPKHHPRKLATGAEITKTFETWAWIEARYREREQVGDVEELNTLRRAIKTHSLPDLIRVKNALRRAELVADVVRTYEKFVRTGKQKKHVTHVLFQVSRLAQEFGIEPYNRTGEAAFEAITEGSSRANIGPFAELIDQLVASDEVQRARLGHSQTHRGSGQRAAIRMVLSRLIGVSEKTIENDLASKGLGQQLRTAARLRHVRTQLDVETRAKDARLANLLKRGVIQVVDPTTIETGE